MQQDAQDNTKQDGENVVTPPTDDNVKLTKEEHAAFLEAVKERDTLKAHKDKFEQDRKDQVAKEKAKQAEIERKAAEEAGDWKKVLELRDQEIAELKKQWEDKQAADEANSVRAKINEAASKIAKELEKTHLG